jgi:hypothetical protein
VRADVVANIVRPGAFTPVERCLMFHIHNRISENQFGGIFIDDSRNREEHTTVVAEYGQIVQRPRWYIPGDAGRQCRAPPAERARPDDRGVRPLRLGIVIAFARHGARHRFCASG